ncbi:MAG: winged helix-turn-helix domain-containing protein, partial [Myxococcota bacterium]
METVNYPPSLLRDRFRLGDAVIDPRLGLIERDGRRVRVPPKVMEVLICLAAAGTELVDRETLMHRVWPDVVVSDDTVTTYMSELRRALGDTSKTRRVISTVPKRGYRLQVAASSLPPHADGESLDPKPPHETAEAPRLPTRRTATLAACVLGVTLPLTSIPFLMLTPTTPTDGTRLVIVPFENETGEPEVQFFAEGIAGQLAERLQRHEDLMVFGAGSGTRLVGVEPRDFHEILDTDLVLHGTVRRNENQILAAVRLFDAHLGTLQWSEDFRSSPKEIVTIPPAIVKRTFEVLSLTPVEETPGNVPQLTSEQYQRHLAAIHHVQELRPESLRLAIRHYTELVEEVPRFAQAYAQIAISEALLIQYSDVPADQAAPRVQRAARKALELDPNCGHAHHALGLLAGYRDENLVAISEFRAAARLLPGRSGSLSQLARISIYEHRPKEALVAARRGIQIDPLSIQSLSILGMSQYAAGLAVRSEQTFNKVIELSPDHLNAYWG